MILQDLDDYEYWAEVDELVDLLQHIHETQIMSESSYARLDYVAQRWKQIKKHIKQHKRADQLLNIYKARYKVQVAMCHQFAWLLNPLNVHESLQGSEQSKIFTYIKAHVPEGDHIKAQKEFISFRRIDGDMQNAELWEKKVIEDPLTF